VEVLDANGNPTGSGTSVSLQDDFPSAGELITYLPKITPPSPSSFRSLTWLSCGPFRVVDANGIATSRIARDGRGTYTLAATSSIGDGFQLSDSFQVGAPDDQAPIHLVGSVTTLVFM